MGLEDKTVFGKVAIISMLDVNDDENEVIKQDLRAQQEYTFQRGQIEAIGIDLKRYVEEGLQSSLKIGDKIKYRKSGSQKMRHEGKDYFVIKYEDIVLVE